MKYDGERKKERIVIFIRFVLLRRAIFFSFEVPYLAELVVPDKESYR